VPIINTSWWCCFLGYFRAFFPRSPRHEHERDRSLSEVHVFNLQTFKNWIWK